MNMNGIMYNDSRIENAFSVENSPGTFSQYIFNLCMGKIHDINVKGIKSLTTPTEPK